MTHYHRHVEGPEGKWGPPPARAKSPKLLITHDGTEFTLRGEGARDVAETYAQRLYRQDPSTQFPITVTVQREGRETVRTFEISELPQHPVFRVRSI